MKKNTYPGKFIVFEGLDASGQTTQANLLTGTLKENHKEVILTKEPTGESEAGKHIRNVLDKKELLGPEELQRLFAKDRKEHLEKTIIPALQKGIWVVCDRYAFSSFAFGTAAGCNLEDLIELNNEFLLPDITFLLNVSPAVCMERIGKRGEPVTLFEEEQKLQRVWRVYETLPSKFQNMHVVDGEQPIEKVANNIWQITFPQLA
ncbi:MAG: dTMP kinase [Patescibacteria group bacterium]